MLGQNNSKPHLIVTTFKLVPCNCCYHYKVTFEYITNARNIYLMGLSLSTSDTNILIDVTDNRQPKTKQEAELQHRIMNILNQSGPGNQPPPQGIPSPWQQPPAATPAPLLNDPTVQKALDSLIQGDLLKKITPGNPGPVRPPQQPLFGAYAGNRR